MLKLNKSLVVLLAFAALVVMAGSAALLVPTTGYSQGPPTVKVNVENTPLPVQGSIGVSGPVAATQSGAWNVGINGTPAVAQSGAWNVGINGTPGVTSADETVLMGSFAGDIPGGNAFTEAVPTRDARAMKTVRVVTNCFLGATVCGNIYVRVYTVVGNRSYLMEQFQMKDFQVASSVYELIGQTVAVQLLNTNGSTSTNIGVAVFGRAN